jgi:hypothetical protein
MAALDGDPRCRVLKVAEIFRSEFKENRVDSAVEAFLDGDMCYACRGCRAGPVFLGG